MLFVCLNPSTADHEAKGNTSRVCINYAKRWGFGGLVIANLFVYRLNDRSKIYEVFDPVELESDDYLKRLSSEASETVCAWSDDGGYMERDLVVFSLLRSPKCLTILKSGRLGHPLYKSKELNPVTFTDNLEDKSN